LPPVKIKRIKVYNIKNNSEIYVKSTPKKEFATEHTEKKLTEHTEKKLTENTEILGCLKPTHHSKLFSHKEHKDFSVYPPTFLF